MLFFNFEIIVVLFVFLCKLQLINITQILIVKFTFAKFVFIIIFIYVNALDYIVIVFILKFELSITSFF